MVGHTGMETSLAYFLLNFAQKYDSFGKIWKSSKMGKNALTIGRESFSAILLNLPSLTKRCLRVFSSRQIQIRHDNWDRTFLVLWAPFLHNCQFLPNQTNSIKCPKKCPQLWKHTIFYCYMRFFCPWASTHLNVLYEKSWPTMLYRNWNMFQTF